MKPESLLQIQIVEYLSSIAEENDFIFFSIPNEGAMAAGKGKVDYALMTTLKKMGMLPGVPDLCIIKNGKALFMEVKTETGSLSKVQKIAIERIKDCKALVVVVRSFEDCVMAMIEYIL